MKTQLVTLFGLSCLFLCTMAQDNSTNTASLASSDDVKPALSEVQAANQKVDNQELDRSDVKEKISDVVDNVADKFNDAKQVGSDAVDSIKAKATDAAGNIKNVAETAADKMKETASAAKEKIENSASTVSFSVLISSAVMLMLALA